jgi:hypothetical protein
MRVHAPAAVAAEVADGELVRVGELLVDSTVSCVAKARSGVMSSQRSPSGNFTPFTSAPALGLPSEIEPSEVRSVATRRATSSRVSTVTTGAAETSSGLSRR